MEDADIIKRVKQGDLEIFSLVVEKYHRKMLGFIYVLTRDKDLAEDLGQDVFLQVYKSLGGFDEEKGTPFSAWLFITARNRCISEIRSRARKRRVSLDDVPYIKSESSPVLERMMDEERRRILNDSLEQLDEPYKSAIIESLQGYSLTEIAAKRGVAVGTIKSRLFRAKKTLKAFIMGQIGDKEYE